MAERSDKPDTPRPQNVAELAELLRAGRLVAFPTETVYGLGANALDADAVLRIFEAKGRPANIPLIVHIADIDQLSTVTARQPELAMQLAAEFWPGPLTLVLPRAPTIPDAVTAGLDTIGVRVPAHPLAHELLTAAGVPVAAPSANPFTRISPTTAEHVRAQLGDRVDAVLDGGPTDVGIESTVVNVCGERPVLLRPGSITIADLEAVVGPVARATPTADPHAPQPSPGTSERHYAPTARLVEVARDPNGNLRLPTDSFANETWALISFDRDDASGVTASEPAMHRPMPRDAANFGRQLFATLHDLDAAGCTLAFVEQLPPGAEWEAVADRLRRAGLARPGDEGAGR